MERLGVMLNFNLKQLCGPENKGLIVSEGVRLAGTHACVQAGRHACVQAGRHTCMCTGRQAGMRVYRQMTDADTHSCTIHAPFMHHSCTIHAPFMHHSCAIHAPFMHHSCTIHAPFMHHCTCTHFHLKTSEWLGIIVANTLTLETTLANRIGTDVEVQTDVGLGSKRLFGHIRTSVPI